MIATYNRSNLLARALDSLISQTEINWEAIVVDDGSTDDTEYLISLYTNKSTQINYVKIKHGGEVVAKNFGIQLAKGKFVTFLDSDDEYKFDHLMSRKLLLIQNPNIHFLYGGVSIIGNNFVPDCNNQFENINLHNCVIGGTFFIERRLLLASNGFSQIAYGADADLFNRLTIHNKNVMKTNLPTYIYHHDTPKSITNNLTNAISQR